jgi:hypothetical protein
MSAGKLMLNYGAKNVAKASRKLLLDDSALGVGEQQV